MRRFAVLVFLPVFLFCALALPCGCKPSRKAAAPSGLVIVSLVMEPALATAKPYEAITYTMTYTNTGEADASNVVLTIPVPENTDYVMGSAVSSADSVVTVEPGIVSFALSTPVAPDETGTVSIQARIQ